MPESDQGVSPSHYAVIPRTLVFLTDAQGRVLLLKGAASKRLWAGRYNGLGGHLEPGEDALGCARRELLEESGLQSSDLRLCGTLMVDSGQNPGVVVFIFRGTPSAGSLLASAEGSLEWVSPSDLPGLPLVEDLPVLLRRVLSARPGDPPFSARSRYEDHERLVVEFSG